MKINFAKSYRGRPLLRSWRRDRNPEALLAILKSGHIPEDLVPWLIEALEAHLDRGADLNKLIGKRHRGKSGNPALRAGLNRRRAYYYGACLAAHTKGFRGDERFVQAAKALVESGLTPDLLRKSSSQRATFLRQFYYKCRRDKDLALIKARGEEVSHFFNWAISDGPRAPYAVPVRGTGTFKLVFPK